jgi:hypothetical protein
MAVKKAATKNVAKEVELQKEKTVAVSQTLVKEPAAPKWEIKDRTYILSNGNSPLTHTIPSRHTRKYSLLYFDEETGTQKELRYGTNQSSPLVEEQKGEVTVGHIIFDNGSLVVPKAKQNLQKLLSLYHPLRDKVYFEFDSVEEAVDDLDILELQIDALNAASLMDIDQVEAIMRTETGSKVSKMSSKELKRDLLLFARGNPYLFLELANDENVELRNLAVKSVELGIVSLSSDQRTFSWSSNGRKLMTVPFDENPYSAMAAFFKTDEGVEVFRSIEKKLK